MKVDICDICGEVIKDIVFNINIRARVKTPEGTYQYQQEYIKKKVKNLKLIGDFEVCEGCKRVIDHLFKMRIKEVKKIRRKVNRILKKKAKTKKEKVKNV